MNCETRDPRADAQAEEQACERLEQRERDGECTKVDTRAVGDGAGDTGMQYFYEDVYECEGSGAEGQKTVTKTRTNEVYECEGDISCMGEDCVNIERDVSDDFEKAVGLLDTLGSIGNDMECTTDDPESCRVFPGKAQECKQALGGWVDCCETPSGVSLSSYIAMAKATRSLDSSLMAADSMPNVQGAWKTIRDPAVTAYDASREAFTSTMDSVTGTTTEAATDAAADGVMNKFKKSAMNSTNTFLKNEFGPEVAETFFTTSPEAGIQLSPGFGTALNVIGTLYTIYVLTDLLVNIIWECTDQELALGADRELQKTYYLGTYCKKDTFFGCLEKAKSYCVFNAPLPRIMQEQARPQLGMSWGSAKSPNCEGIKVSQLDEIDWSQIDLDEWVDLLDLTGHMPDQNMDPESITGSGSTLNTELGRDNTIDRTQKRAEGANIGEQNEETRREGMLL